MSLADSRSRPGSSTIGSGIDLAIWPFWPPENGFTLGAYLQRTSALEFPALGKFRFGRARRGWRPFVTAGPTVRRTSSHFEQTSATFSGAPLSGTFGAPFITKQVQWDVDPAAGLGMDFRTGRFHLEPEVRYSYWGAGTRDTVRKNEVNFLLGFRF